MKSAELEVEQIIKDIENKERVKSELKGRIAETQKLIDSLMRDCDKAGYLLIASNIEPWVSHSLDGKRSIVPERIELSASKTTRESL